MSFTTSFSTIDITMIERVSVDDVQKSSSHFAWRVLFIVALLVLTVFAVHRPLPNDFAERHVMHVVDAAMQITYMQPVRLMTALGVSHATSVLHVRRVLDLAGRMLSPFGVDPDMTIYETEIAGVRVWVYEPTIRSSEGALVFVHGGGFVVGEIEGYDCLVRTLTRQLGMVVVSVDYRRAPEHTYPSAHDDVESVALAMLQHAHLRFGVDPAKIVVAGDSAGGNLVAVTTHRIKRLNDMAPELPKIKAQVLFYPLVQFHSFSLSSFDDYFATMDGTAFLDPTLVLRSYLLYMGVDGDETHVEALLDGQRWKDVTMHKFGHRLTETVDNSAISSDVAPSIASTHEHAARLDVLFGSPQDWSPLLADDLTDLPRAFVATVQYDILRSEGGLYARAMAEAGVSVDYHNYETGFHAMLNFYKYLPVAQRMIKDTTDWIKMAVDE